MKRRDSTALRDRTKVPKRGKRFQSRVIINVIVTNVVVLCVVNFLGSPTLLDTPNLKDVLYLIDASIHK